jgi:hypothetical protein
MIKGRNSVLDRDGVIAKTKDTIEACKSKSESRFLDRFGKTLVLDINTADAKSIMTNETFQGTSTILNGKLGAVLDKCVGFGRVITTVKETGDGITVGGRNPKVRGTCIKDNSECLGRCTQFNLTKVL